LYAHAGAAPDSTNIKKPDYFIDTEQERIDKLDGVADGKIDLKDSVETIHAHKIYFVMVDSIQRLIDRSKLKEEEKKFYRESLFILLRKVNPYNVYRTRQFESSFRFVIGILNAKANNKLLEYLSANPQQALKLIPFYKREPCADTFFIATSKFKPKEILQSFDLISDRAYAQLVLDEAAKTAPVTVKRYFSKGDLIFERLQQSTDSSVIAILKINSLFGKKSNAFALLDGIMKGKYSIQKADSIGNDKRQYLKALLEIRKQKHPLAEFSVEQDLEIYALKFTRVINDLHNEKDTVRFASVNKFDAEELYTLIVYSEEEIFTSTFNGLFKRMKAKMDPKSGYEFLNDLGNNRFRTFIKMAAGFGKLTEFLSSMTTLHKQLLMVKFASNLEENPNDISQAVEVADAFGSITDSLVIRILKGTIKYEYIRLNNKKDFRGVAIYGLLSNLFVERSGGNDNWYNSISRLYSVPPFDKVKIESLFGFDSINRWMIYFYDDEDGDASFKSFIKSFTDSSWAVIDSGIYVTIKSKTGKRVNIYANKPKNEYDGQERLEKLFADSIYEPNVMVHRGHSYYAAKTIDKIKDNTQIFVLGSCGGYHSISSIIEKSADISIISSKQIGTMYVNNPMLKLVAENIRQNENIEWAKLWAKLDTTVKVANQNPKAYERFLDYIPPHKNLGAIFIKTFNKMMQLD
jgi:hypothetical protein